VNSSRILNTINPTNTPGIKIKNRADLVVPIEFAMDALSRNDVKKIASASNIQILNLMSKLRFSWGLSTSQL
jgi:hypothetical protein